MDSPEALFLFLGKNRAKKIKITPKIGDLPICQSSMLKAHIIDQIDKLQTVNMSIDGWKEIVYVSDDNFDDFTDGQIQTIRHRATYLAMVYYLSLEMYDSCTNFTTVIQLAMNRVNSTHLNDFLPKKSKYRSTYIVNTPRVVLNWFRQYRDDDCLTIGPPPSTKGKLPPILNANPDLLNSLLYFCRQNINQLSVELVHDFLLSKAIPELAENIKKEQNLTETQYSTTQQMSDFGHCSLCIKTVQKWMNKIGFKYEPRRKTYYVDMHEAPVNVEYRTKFIKCYFEYELCAHRWYSIPENERN